MKLRKVQKRLQARQNWWETNVDKASGRCKPLPGCGSPTGRYHRPGSNKK